VKSYLISDPLYYGDTTNQISSNLRKINKQFDIACFRDKSSIDIKNLAKEFFSTCRDLHVENIFINTHINLANELGFDGVHLTSKQFNDIENALDLGLKVIVSTHSLEEINKLSQYDIFAFTYSPIFLTPNKGEPKGIDMLKKVVSSTDKNIIALGGIISQKHIDDIAATNAYGFASIRYFLD
jgi:thiamine-phosphate pyrophosphorylase